jgi:hypothetical protein
MSCFETTSDSYHVKIAYWGTYREPALLTLTASPFASLHGRRVCYHLRTIPTKTANDPRRARWLAGADGFVLVLLPEGKKQRRPNLLPELAQLLSQRGCLLSPPCAAVENVLAEGKPLPWVLYPDEQILYQHHLFDGDRAAPRDALLSIIEKVYAALEAQELRGEVPRVGHYLQAPEWRGSDQARARDPNLSARELKELAQYYPNDVLQNEALSLLSLEEPALLEIVKYHSISGSHHASFWGFVHATRQTKLLFQAGVAERVLWVYEARFPQDERVREAIKATRLYALGEIASDEWSAAIDGARQADQEAHELSGSCQQKHVKDPLAGAAAHAAMTATFDEEDVGESSWHTLGLFAEVHNVCDADWITLWEAQWQEDFVSSLLASQGVDVSKDTWGWPAFEGAVYSRGR